MLLCKEQKKKFIFEEKEIVVSDKHLNAYFAFHDMMLDELAISVIFSTYKSNMSKHDIISMFTADELSRIIEGSIKSEISGLMRDDFDEFWVNIPE